MDINWYNSKAIQDQLSLESGVICPKKVDCNLTVFIYYMRAVKYALKELAVILLDHKYQTNLLIIK